MALVSFGRSTCNSINNSLAIKTNEGEVDSLWNRGAGVVKPCRFTEAVDNPDSVKECWNMEEVLIILSGVCKREKKILKKIFE